VLTCASIAIPKRISLKMRRLIKQLYRVSYEGLHGGSLRLLSDYAVMQNLCSLKCRLTVTRQRPKRRWMSAGIDLISTHRQFQRY